MGRRPLQRIAKALYKMALFQDARDRSKSTLQISAQGEFLNIKQNPVTDYIQHVRLANRQEHRNCRP